MLQSLAEGSGNMAEEMWKGPEYLLWNRFSLHMMGKLHLWNLHTRVTQTSPVQWPTAWMGASQGLTLRWRAMSNSRLLGKGESVSFRVKLRQVSQSHEVGPDYKHIQATLKESAGCCACTTHIPVQNNNWEEIIHSREGRGRNRRSWGGRNYVNTIFLDILKKF